MAWGKEIKFFDSHFFVKFISIFLAKIYVKNCYRDDLKCFEYFWAL